MSEESVTYGFFDGKFSGSSYDRLYDPAHMSEIFDGVIMDGVYLNWEFGTMKVTKGIGPRSIYVEPGKAWYKGTWTINSETHIIRLADIYDSESTYSENDYCVYPGDGETDRLYRCITDISEAEEWDSTHWEVITYGATETLIDFAVVLEVNKTEEVRYNSIKSIRKEDIVHTDDIDDYVLAYVKLAVNSDYPAGFIYDHNIDYVVGTDESPYFAWMLQDLSVESVITKWTEILGQTTIEFLSWFDVMQRLLDPDYEEDRFSCMYPIVIEASQNLYVDGILPRVDEAAETFYGDGSTRIYSIRGSAASISNVRVNGTKRQYQIPKEDPLTFVFLDPPADGSIIVARYVPYNRANYNLYFDEP